MGWGGAFHAIRAEGATVTVTQLTDAGAGAKLVLDVPESAEYRYRVIDDHLFVLAGRKNDFDIVVVAPGGEVVGRGNKATAFTTSDYWIGPGLPDGGAFVEYLQTRIDGTGEHLSALSRGGSPRHRCIRAADPGDRRSMAGSLAGSGPAGGHRLRQLRRAILAAREL